MELKSCVSPNKRPTVRLYESKNCQKFKNDMEKFDWDALLRNSLDWYTDFVCKLKTIFDQAFPLVQLSKKRSKDKPWIFRGLKACVVKNHQFYKQSLTHPTDTNRIYIRIVTEFLKIV